MKRRVINCALIAAAFGTIAAGAAYATPVLTIDGTPITLTPTLPNEYSYFDSVSGWGIVGTVADYSPSMSPEGLDFSTYTVTCLTKTMCASTPLTVVLSETGFTTAVAAFTNQLSDTQTGKGSVTQTADFDTADTIPATDPIGSVTLTGTGAASISGGSPAGPGAYSLTLTDLFTASGGAVTFSTDGDITSVPEPGTFALFGAGLLGFAIYLRRRRRT